MSDKRYEYRGMLGDESWEVVGIMTEDDGDVCEDWVATVSTETVAKLTVMLLQHPELARELYERSHQLDQQ